MESRPRPIIASACLALESTVGKTVADVTNFVRHCRPARADLTPITRELSELQMVLELLNDFGQYGQYGGDRQQDAIPQQLQAHLRPILSNCITVVLRIDGVLRRHGQSEADGSAKWTAEGKTEMAELRPSLEVHRGALGHISDLISISISRASDGGGSSDAEEPELQVQDVIQDLQEVRSSILISDSNATLARQHFALQVHLGQIIAYAETLNKQDPWDEAAIPSDLLVSGTDTHRTGITPSRVSTAASSYREEEITEEALAFAQVPVHIMGRLSLNLVGHVYTNNSGRSGSDGTSFNRSISTFETEGEVEEAEAEGYAASTGTSDTGSLRDGHLQFSQIDVTQVTPPAAHEAHPGEHVLPQQAAGHQPVQALQQPPPSREIHEQASMSTMNTQTFLQGKPLPRTPLVYVPQYPGPFTRKKVVVVGNFSCGKTCLITRMARGHYPRGDGNSNRSGVMETVKVSVDEEPVELSLWDIRGIDYDPSWLHNAQVALICFSVNIASTDAKGKHLGRWVTEINRNCPSAAILLVGLKSDIRWHAKTVEKLRKHGKTLVTPGQGEQLRDSIGAIRYLECSARTGDGVLEVLEEATRVSLLVNNEDFKKDHRRPLSRIGKFLGLSSRSD
ncbi:hypothetical protein UCDDA912_g04998 [Diaporthe ampelina]|uniref:Uncharacterized protein n=1 Tax=Diaporthe ampelina TaxID=1214573 RepID=A0A0G2HJ04_9PEZI|nr:hypothetical protein UCDDA912_g04998 [Diaporthe ampelina]